MELDTLTQEQTHDLTLPLARGYSRDSGEGLTSKLCVCVCASSLSVRSLSVRGLRHCAFTAHCHGNCCARSQGRYTHFYTVAVATQECYGDQGADE